MSTLHLRRKRKSKASREAPQSGEAKHPARTGVMEARNDDDAGELPQERVESESEESANAPPPSQRRVAKQAQRDIERGLEDTDCRSDHGEDSACPPRPKLPSS